MKISQYWIVCLLAAAITACSSSNFVSGGTPAKPPKKEQTNGAFDAATKNDPKPTETREIEATESPAIGTDEDLSPDGIVEGQEVIKDCDRCVARAKQLSPQAGFSASKDLTTNLGFYKIEPSQNLCDIHFLANFNVPIDDHNGEDTVGNEQIILYCPCDCGWAQSGPPPAGILGGASGNSFGTGGGGW